MPFSHASWTTSSASPTLSKIRYAADSSSPPMLLEDRHRTQLTIGHHIRLGIFTGGWDVI